MTLKKDLIKLLNKYSESTEDSGVVMQAILSLDGTSMSVQVTKSKILADDFEPKIYQTPEKPGVTILKDKIIIVPTPTEDYPKGLIIECNGKKAEGDIKVGISEYPLPPIMAEGETAKAYIKPKQREPIMVGSAEAGYGKTLVSSVELPKSPEPANFPGL